MTFFLNSTHSMVLVTQLGVISCMISQIYQKLYDTHLGWVFPTLLLLFQQYVVWDNVGNYDLSDWRNLYSNSRQRLPPQLARE